MQRKWMSLLLAGAMLLVWSASAQALTIDLSGKRKARSSVADDTVYFSGKRKKSRTVVTVNLASAGTVDYVVKRKKKGKKRTLRRSWDLAAGEHTFVLKGKRSTRMTFTEGAPAGPAVPEPSTVALLGTGLAGLAMAGRRRR